MSHIAKIQQEILALSQTDYTQLRQWFSELDWEKWDRQIESDSDAGKLDFLIAEALEEKEKGTLKELQVHKRTSRFRRYLQQYPESVQRIARQNFNLLKTNPRHPSLHFKKVGKYWSARVGEDHRVLAVKDGNDFIWVWIGKHDEYERLIRS